MAEVVNLHPDNTVGNKPTLDALHGLVSSDVERVNHLILDRMQSSVSLIPQLAGHIIAAGGKRLRPMLTLAAAKLCGYEGEHHIALATCVEFIHTATLLHDDVVDQSLLRRGQDSANSLWGDQASVLVGDFLFSKAFQIMVEIGSLDVLAILSEASAVIAEGEVLQLVTTNDTETSEEAYLEVVHAKTAKLFAAATELGAVVASRSKAEQQALESYGMNLGIAFQLIDDVLDYSASETEFGKSVGDDFREGKVNLPVVLAWRRGNEVDKAFWRRTMEDLNQRDGDFDEAVEIMQRYGALRDSIERARHYGAIARDACGIFPDSEIKSALVGTIDFCIERAH